MPNYSSTSLANLSQVDHELRDLFMEVIKWYDHSIVCGYRSPADQLLAYSSGREKIDGIWQIKDKGQIITYCDGITNPSNHNKLPSQAIDVKPYPADWNDNLAFAYFAGHVMEIYRWMKEKGLLTKNIRWGGDWNNNGRTDDERLVDVPHYEIY